MAEKKRAMNTAAYVILILGALLILFPLYITVVTTFKTSGESANSFFTLPQSLYLGNYKTVLENPTLWYAYGNTAYITLFSLVLELLVMPPMSFALSRGMFHGSKIFKGLYFFFLLGIFSTLGYVAFLSYANTYYMGRILPFQVRMMPLVKLLSALNMMNPTGMVLLYLAHATCESMFLYVGYLASVSPALEEAAYIDGATTLQTFYQIILPLMKPILATVMIREGLAIWNDYMLPLLCLNRSNRMWTLTLFQYNFQSEFNVDYNLAFSCLVIASLPIIVMYCFMQKQIIGGLTNGAVKG